MRKLIMIACMLSTSANCVVTAPALAQTGDINCTVGTSESVQFFTFYPTSIAKSGVVIGEVSEVEYVISTDNKTISRDEKYEYGHMPVWSVLANPDGGVTFLSKSDPSLSITVTERFKPWDGTAELRHNGRVVDTGICSSD
jgi:hypothetical protein